MKTIVFFSASFFVLLGLPALADEVNTGVVDFEKRHKDCIELIAEDAELAYEEASIWQSQGGGRRARHCVAMTLFALGHPDEAAFRLDKLATSPDGGNEEMRADTYAEAADLWLQAPDANKAHQSASAGLKLDETHVDLRIALARALAAQDKWDEAETELTNVLTYAPQEPRALRYRADARKRQGKLTLAKADIDRAVALNEDDVSALLVRGQINEAIRLHDKTAEN